MKKVLLILNHVQAGMGYLKEEAVNAANDEDDDIDFDDLTL